MAYTLDKVLRGMNMEEAEARAREALMQEGFGVLTEIDVSATLKKKLDVDMPGYKILGACNPRMAHQAIEMEPKLGAVLPCNVILREVEQGVEVSIIDPEAMMQPIENPALAQVAEPVRQMLQKALDAM